MKKWNMIIDVAECTNCNLCTLATMDEYVGNDWPGYAAPMPKHGHKWINILQKERGQAADDRCRLCADHVQPLRRRALHRRRHGRRDHASATTASCSSIRSRPRARRSSSKPVPMVTSGGTRSCGLPQLGLRCASHRSGLAADARAAIVPDRARCARSSSRMTRWSAWRATKASRRCSPSSARRPRVYYRNLWRYSKCFIGGSVSAEANGVVDCLECAKVRLSKDRHLCRRGGDRQFRRLQIRPARREFGCLSHRDYDCGRRKEVDRGRSRSEHESRRNSSIEKTLEPSRRNVSP